MPLASIFGSGLLVIVPVLASGMGPYVIPAMLAISVVALQTGAIVRHNTLCSEPVLARDGSNFTVIALASRAFALYYLLQCLVVLTVFRNPRECVRFFMVGLALGFILIFAVPAG